jgi:acyl carrier protein
MFEEIKQLIAEILNVKLANIQLTSSFGDDLGIDSLDAIELIIALEDAFSVKIEDTEVEKVKTIQDIVTLLEAKRNESFINI